MFLKFFNSFNGSVFIKPFKKKTFSILKAPHRFKRSRHLLKFSRYYIYLTINLYKNNKKLTTFEIIKFLNDLIILLKKIDSSVCYQKSLKISLNFSYKNIFHIK